MGPQLWPDVKWAHPGAIPRPHPQRGVCVLAVCLLQAWLHMALTPETLPAPELSAQEELSPGQELRGAGDSAAVQGLLCWVQEQRQELQLCFPEAAAAEKRLQQPRALAREPPHARQRVVKLLPQPAAPRRNSCGFRSHKCQRGICWPRGPPDPLTKGAVAPGLPRLTWLRPAQVTGQHLLTPGPCALCCVWLCAVFGSLLSPLRSPLTLPLGQVCQQVGLQGAGPAPCGLGGPGAPCIPLPCPGTALLGRPALPREGGGLLGSSQAVVGWKDLQRGWGPPKNPARLLPPPCLQCQHLCEPRRATGQTCVFI